MNPGHLDPHIAAVVLHDGGDLRSAEEAADGVAATFHALSLQTRAPDTIIELDAPGYRAPSDLSRSARSHLLQEKDANARSSRRTSEAGSVTVPSTPLWRALERQLPHGFHPRPQWLWIVPAGAIPAADALEKLEDRLFTVTDESTHSDIQIIGAKQLHADSHAAEEADRLVDVGLYSARSAEVVSLTEPKELDQGQYDGRDAVPAVSAHGMLVHAPLFGDLGGFDPELPADYAAAHFCARAREVGAHVVIAPAARIYREHPDTPTSRRLSTGQLHRLGGMLYLPADQRRGQIRRRLAVAHPLLAPLLWLGMWVATGLRLLGLTAVKAPDAALGQFVTSVGALLNLAAVVRIRGFGRLGRRIMLERLARDEQITDERSVVRSGRATQREMQLSAEALREHRQAVLTAEAVALPQVESARSAGASRIARGTGDSEQDEESLLSVGAGEGEFDQMPSRRGGDRLALLLVLIGLTGLSLLAFRSLLGASVLGGGSSLPVSGSLPAVFANTVSLISAEGLGERAAADPFSVVALLLSAVTVGNASLVLLWVVILAMPLSALTAWWSAGTWTSTPTQRIIAALLWAAVPSVHIAMGQGRIGAVLVHVLIPVFAVALMRALRPGRRGGWEAATAAALLLAVITASAPALLIPAVLFSVIGALAMGRRGRPLWLVPLPSLAVALPMIGSAAVQGSNVIAVLLAEPGRALAGAPAPVWQQLLGFPEEFSAQSGLPGAAGGGAWLPEYFDGGFWSLRVALLIGAPLLILAVLGTISAGQRRAAAIVAAALALATLGYSALIKELSATQDGVSVIPGNPGPLVSVIIFCLLLAAISSLERLPQAWPRIGGSITPVVSTLLVFSVVASIGLWALPRVEPSAEPTGQPLTAVNSAPTLITDATARQIPATAADQGEGPAQLRTLVLSADEEGVVGELVTGSGVTVDEGRAVVTSGDVPLWAAPQNIPGLLGGGEDAADGSAEGELSPAQGRLAQLIASIVVSGSSQPDELMAELGIGYVLVAESGDAAPGAAGQGAAGEAAAVGVEQLVDAVDTSAGLVSVGDTDRGLLWRADVEEMADLPSGPGVSGAATSWARIVDAEGTIQALLPSAERHVETSWQDIRDGDGEQFTLEPGEQYFVELASESARGWNAELGGEELSSVGAVSQDAAADGVEDSDVPWMQRFEITADQVESAGQDADLTVSHRSPYQLPVLIAVGAFLLLVLLIAVPLPQGMRMKPVASADELASLNRGTRRSV